MEQIDPKIKSLVQAIGQAETGDDPNAYQNKGASGEYGRYQFTEPTWRSYAKEILGDENADITSIENQNKVTYGKVKQLKEQGYNPAQIASIWNAGDPEAYKNGKRGVNQYGVEYDVPSYVAKVSDNYRKLSSQLGDVPNIDYTGANQEATQQSRQQMISEGKPVSVNPEKAQPSFLGGIVRDALSIPASFLASTAGLFSSKENEQKIKQGDLLKGTAVGDYLGKVYPVGYNEKNTEQPSIASSIGTGLEAASYLPIAGGAGAGLEAVKLGAKGLFKQVVKKALVSGVEGAVGGGLQGAGSAMEQSKPFGDVAKETAIGAATGAVIGGGLGATGAVIGKGIGLGKTGLKLANVKSGVSDLTEQEYTKELSNLSNEFQSKLNLNRTQQKVVDKGMRYHGQSPIQTLIEKDIFPTTEDGVVDTQSMRDKLQDTLDNFTDTADTYAKNDSSLYSAENMKNALRENLSQQFDDGKISSVEYEKLLKIAESEIDKSVALDKLPTKIENGVESGTLSSKSVNRLRKLSNSLTNWNNPQAKKSYGYALGNATRDILEKEGMFGSDYRDFNKDWSKYINAKEFIDSLGDRKQFRTPGGFAGKIARLTTAGISIGNKSSLLGALTSLVGLDSAEQLIRNPNFTSIIEKELVKEGNKKFTQPEMADILRKRIFEKTILNPLKSKTKLLTGSVAQETKNVTQDEIDNAIKEYIKRNPSSLQDIGQGQIGINKETEQGIISGLKSKKGLFQTAVDNIKDPAKRKQGLIRIPGLSKKETPSVSYNNDTIESLLKEANKYKSADEFVKAQEDKLYIHGTQKKIEGKLELKSKASGVQTPEKDAVDVLYVTPNTETGKMHSRMYTKQNGVTYAIKLKPEAKIFDYTNPSHRKMIEKTMTESQKKLVNDNLVDGQLSWMATPPVKNVKKLGFDGMKQIERKAGEDAYSATFGDAKYSENAESLMLFNKNVFEQVDTAQTKSQLTDIYNKANKKVTLPKKK